MRLEHAADAAAAADSADAVESADAVDVTVATCAPSLGRAAEVVGGAAR